MHIEDARDAAEEFFADHDVEADGQTLTLQLASVAIQDDGLLIKLAFDDDSFDGGEPSPRAIEAAVTALDEFREEYPELEELPVAFEYVAT